MTLVELQSWLKKHKIDAYLVNHDNRFPKQDILLEENAILQLTGFSGSAGNLLVLQNSAMLFVDGRYELQSKLETDPTKVEIHCTGQASPFSWMVRELDSNIKCKIMYDPWTLLHSDLTFYEKELKHIKFVPDTQELLGSRLSTKPVKVFEHNIEYCGMERDEKIAEVIKKLKLSNKECFLTTRADSVSWLLNLRSDALPNTPVLRAYALVDKNGNINIFGGNLNYPNIQPFSALKKTLKAYKNKKVSLSSDTPQMIFNLLPSPDCADLSFELIEDIKAVKNPIEIQAAKKSHIRDAAAVINFLFWLNNNRQGKTELDIVAKLRSFREQQDLFYSDSFSTIAGFGPNGAIVHYQPNKNSNLALESGSILLLDSGAQYYDGTTDVTRTLAIGTPTQEMIDDFTTVLKCHIELTTTYFPYTTDGKQLDSICRHQLWATGRDYKHGTGHGVGCFLNVHEGPNLISPNGRHSIYKPGMITSIEPGYYKEGAYGIRIENLVYIDKVENNEFEVPMLKFVPLTLIPLDKHLINKYLLNQREIKWLNDYHQKIWTEISPFINTEARPWLEDACSPI